MMRPDNHGRSTSWSFKGQLVGIPLVVLACCLLTMILFWNLHRNEEASLRRSFSGDAVIRSHLISTELHHALSHLAPLRISAQRITDYGLQDFGEITAPVMAERIGIHALQWIPRVSDEERARFEDTVRREGRSGFRITELDPRGRITAANRREVYYPVLFVEPLKGNKGALGFDHGSILPRIEAMEKARDSGRTAATGLIPLMQDEGRGAGFLVFEPVYARGMPTGGVDERRKALKGFILGVFRLDDVMKAAIGHTIPVNMPTDLLDLSAARGKRLLYHWKPRLSGDETPWWHHLLYPEPPPERYSFSIADREWQVVVNAGPVYVQRHYRLMHWLVLPFGLLLTAIFAMYLYAVLTRKVRAEAMVERRTVELALSEQKYRSLFEQNRDGLVICNMDGIILEANPSAIRMTGYGLHELQGRSYRDFIPGKWDDIDADIIRNQLLKQGYSEFHDRECIRKDGTVLPLSVRAWLLKDSGGARGTGVTIWFQDTSELKQIESVLRDQSEQYAAILSTTEDGFWIVDQAGLLMDVNHVYCRMSGYTRDELIGMSVSDLDAMDDRDEIRQRIRKIMDSGTDRFETRHRRRDGSLVNVEVSTTFLSPKKLFIVFIRDITARKQAEDALQESEARLNEAQALAHTGSWEFDLRTSALKWSREVFQIFGLDPVRTRPSHDAFMALVHPQDRQRVEDAFIHSILTPSPSEMEHKLIRPDGALRHIHQYYRTFFDEEHRHVRILGTLQDITDRKLLEEEAFLNQVRMEVLLRITQTRFASIQELLDSALEEAIRLTASRIGYIYHYDDVTQVFTLNTWSSGVMKECTVRDREKLTTYELDKTGIWGEAVRQGGPIILNDFPAPHPRKRGYPDGHAHLERFLTIPVFSRNRIVAVVGVANKEAPYDEADVRQLTLLMSSVWQIVERRKAQEELGESRRMLRMVLDAIPVYVYWKDRESRYLGCNRLLARDAGLSTPEEIVGKTDHDLVWSDMADEYIAEDRMVMETLRPKLEYEEPMTTPDGRRTWVQASKLPLQDDRGHASGVLGISYDITERRWMEHALRQERDRVQLYLDTAEVMLLVLDTGGEVALINRKGCELIGYQESEIMGRNWFEISVPEEERSKVIGAFRGIISGDKDLAKYFENSVLTKSGEKRFFAWHNAVLRDEEGTIIGTLSSGEDITEKRRAEEALRESRERFKKILQDMPLASSYTDDMGNMEFINRSFTDLFGYTLDDVPTIEDWFVRAYPDPDYREEVMARWNADATRARLENTRIGPGEYHVSCRDSTVRICEITGTFLEKGVMAVFVDITDRILAEEAIRQSEERFRVQFRGIPVPTYIWRAQDNDLILIDYNDAALDLTRGRIASFKGIPASRFYEGKDWIIDDMKRCQQEKGTVMNEYWDTLRTTGEKKYLAVKYAFLPPNLVMVHMEDITIQKEAEEHLRYLSIHDPLTGLYNRFYADTEIERLKASRKYPVSVIVIDIDGLKNVNDSEGHAAGDLLIKNAAYILRQTFRPEDMVARTGGDEFLVILPMVDAITLEQLLKRLRVYLTNFNASGPERPVSFSFGSATAINPEELDECIKQADMTMYLEKSRSRAMQQR